MQYLPNLPPDRIWHAVFLTWEGGMWYGRQGMNSAQQSSYYFGEGPQAIQLNNTHLALTPDTAPEN